MRLLHSLLLALVLATTCFQHGRADTLGDAADAAGNAVDTAWSWTKDTAGDVGSWFSNLGCTVSNAVDSFDLAKCDSATEAVPCPAGCADELKKLSSSCLKKMVENQSNSTAAAAEVLACGLTLNGAAGFTSVGALLAATTALAFLL